MKVFYLAFLFFCCFCTSIYGTEEIENAIFDRVKRWLNTESYSSKCPPRVRRPWHRLTKEEKDLYLDAVEKSQSLRVHVLFMHVHMEIKSYTQAHKTSAFILWHRKLILAYENMLRSLGKRYRCLTIPYWDIFRDYSAMQKGKCKSLEDCSQLLKDFGGSRGKQAVVHMMGRTFEGHCCTKRPCHNWCESLHRCSKCIPRGDWKNIPIPPTASYTSILSSILSARNYAKASYNFQNGLHGDFHNDAGSSFSAATSAADPIFYPFHAAIDMLHYLYYNCQRDGPLNPWERRQSNFVFMKKAYLEGIKAPSGNSKVLMQLYDIDRNLVDAYDHPTLGQWFIGIKEKYYHLVDTTKLGSFSYGYEHDALVDELTKLGFECRNAKWSRQQQGHVRALIENEEDNMIAKDYSNWLGQLISEVRNTTKDLRKALKQIEYMECYAFEKRYGLPDHYNDQYKDDYEVKGMKPHCRVILDKVNDGRMKLIHNWYPIYEKYYRNGLH